MRLHEHPNLPNPRRVAVFAHEKGLDIPRTELNVLEGDHKKPDFLAKNPWGKVPVLELDNGDFISETQAICRYLDETHPGGNLFGQNARERAAIDMWLRRIELGFHSAVGAYFHHGTEGLGEQEAFQMKEWGLKNRELAEQELDLIEKGLGDRPYLAGENFSLADIWLIVSIDFAKMVGIELTDKHPKLKAWQGRVSVRPSMAA